MDDSPEEADGTARKLRFVWKQDAVPVILRRDGKGQKLRARLPFAPDNREWLRNGRRSRPKWVSGDGQEYWELPKAWFNDFVNRALDKYGAVYIIQPFREQEVCARACMEATGHECQCSCMGANHGSGVSEGWFEVSETFATRWGDRELACRLLTLKQAKGAEGIRG